MRTVKLQISEFLRNFTRLRRNMQRATLTN